MSASHQWAINVDYTKAEVINKSELLKRNFNGLISFDQSCPKVQSVSKRSIKEKLLCVVSQLSPSSTARLVRASTGTCMPLVLDSQ